MSIVLAALVGILEALPIILFPWAWLHSKRIGTYRNPVARAAIVSCLVAIVLYLFYR